MNIHARRRFWSKVTILEADECWLWMASKDGRGYGQFSHNGNMYRSHRIAFSLWFGEISDGMCVCHKCDNPLCVNPHHLFLGTHADNMRDMGDKGRSHFARTLGEESFNHKLTATEVIAIRKSSGSTRAIGKQYGVSSSTVSDIRLGLTWKHITDIPSEGIAG